MCNEREPLLEYLYGDGDPEDRRRVESHLEACEACRDELAGLRSVREDLLAWEVPAYESVWKPFTPARPVWSWRDVPAWTMAAAAVVVLALGATGSVAANALRATAATSVKSATPVPSATVAGSTELSPALMTAGVPMVGVRTVAATSVSAADLAAFETRVLDEVNHRTQAAPARTSLSSSDQEQLFKVMLELNNALANSQKDVNTLKAQVNGLSTTVAQMAQNQQGGR